MVTEFLRVYSMCRISDHIEVGASLNLMSVYINDVGDEKTESFYHIHHQH